MKSIGVVMGLAALVILISQAFKVLSGTDPLNPADVMVVSAALSMLSTTALAISSVFNKKGG